MLSNNQKIAISVDRKYAQHIAETGNVYNLWWARKYAKDVSILLDEIMRLEDKLNEIENKSVKAMPEVYQIDGEISEEKV